VLAFLVIAAVLPFAATRLGTRAFYLAALPPLAAVVWAVANLGETQDGGALTEQVDWVPDLGLTLGLRFDGFAALMVGLVAGIGVLVFVYARAYFHDGPVVGKFAATLLAFAGSMFGLVLSDNLMALFLFWEATSITSFLLIGTEDEKPAARSGALQALLITGGGGLAMLGGFVLLGETAGTYSLSEILADPPSGAVVDWALVLVLIGALTKSAQVPFHSWLPRAMNAPTPVSAYLHSATMVKAGVYLVARFSPSFADATPWQPIVITAGLATMILGGYRALRQYDLKLVLAYGTISQLGLMMVLFGVATPESVFAGCTLLVAHGIFKAALFMLVGVIDHQTHTRDLRVLGGLGRRWPVVGVTGVVVAASMAGFAPLLGFIAKEEALAGLGGDTAAWAPWSLAVVVVGSALTVAYSARFLWGAFGPAEVTDSPDRESVGTDAPHPSAVFIAPAVLLAVVTVVLGLVPTLLDATVGSAFEALWGGPTDHHLALWHGFTQALALSAVAIVGGLLLFWRREQVQRLQQRAEFPLTAQGGYDRSLNGALHGADVVTGIVQNGSLPIYLGVILTTLLIVPGVPLLTGGELPDLWFADTLPQVAIGGVMVVSAVAAAFARRRFAAVVLIGAVGYGMAALFVVQGAPDLAITQLLIETIAIVIFVLVFRHLPDKFPRNRIRGSQAPRVLIAAGAGVFIFFFTLVAVGSRTVAPVSDGYLTRAYPEAHGKNVVNTIIVDFRGFDTVGEITVLAVAVLGVASIVRSGRRLGSAPDVARVPGATSPEDPAAEERADQDLTAVAERDGEAPR
jgi:multicomponent Na+:H+ antiporter subunit A